MIPDRELIDRMEAYRREHNLTKNDFASLCGLSVQTIKRIEAGSPIHLSSYVLIEQALGIGADECDRLIAKCTAEQRRIYRVKHAEYYKRNREKILAYQRKYYADTAAERAKDRAENPEECRAREAQRREKYRERIRTYNREYQQKRRAKLKSTDPGEASAKPECNGSAEPDRTTADD